MEKAVKDMTLVEILDKNIDQMQLGKDLAVKYLAEKIAELKAKIESGEIDLIKGTDMDKEVLLKGIAALEAVIF
jgi:anti-sigma28 factor (negative regulator of flagellin synthesis)